MRTRLSVLAVAAAAVLSLAACGGGSAAGGGSAGSEGPLKLTYLSPQPPGQGSSLILSKLTESYGQGATLTVDAEDATMDQKIQLLASQDKLPTLFGVGTPAQAEQLFEAGKIVDVEAELTKLGLIDKVNPLALDVERKLYNGKVLTLPLELATEGLWFNKKIFADQGIAEPKTWDELTAAAATLQAKGVQPFATGAKTGWPVTRLVSGYLYRDLGPDALERVKAGTAKLTDPEYVRAAAAVADFGRQGYFGKGAGSIDYATSEDVFLNGKAAMWYSGTWALSDFVKQDKNKIGSDAIGFMPFPTVPGGVGTADQTPANVAIPVAISSKNLTPQVEDWLKHVVSGFADTGMTELDWVSGFKTSVQPKAPLTAEVSKQISSTSQSLLWFEALLGPKGTNVAQTNAAGLISGNLSPEDFMAKVQASVQTS